MPRCWTCQIELERVTPFCPSCGSSLEAADDARTIATEPAARPGSGNAITPSRFSQVAGSAAWLHGQSSGDAGFAPGAVLGGRFRIIGLLGRGGMGEVYRADDLLLGQPVALKFLPLELATNPDRQARFFEEVRIARQVSHPNVCRVYDVGAIEGQPYLSMELVEGDDLSSLLRRIGRLPEDKALDVARQLCAGLAAAHARGVLHRDLKPANIMIDALGKVRITDFGLAVLSDQVTGREKRAGTPAYMAPEQLSRNEISVRSDLYALGLVLYEMFTGRRTFQADTLLEVERLQRDAAPADPSTILEDIDPAVERAILRCLEKDPSRRPESALAVAASLPGGDPLAVALAAGEMPSPELVAAAGGAGALRNRTALALLVATLLGLAWLLARSDRDYLIHRVPLRPRAVLEDRAQQVLADFGYPGRAPHRALGFVTNREYLRWVRDHVTSRDRWDQVSVARSSAIGFWYRSSPRPMYPWNPNRGAAVTITDPPAVESGMTTVTLDPAGRLTGLLAVPAQVDSSLAGGPEPDWSRLFAAAGLEAARFRPATPAWSHDTYTEIRRAWVGSDTELPGVPLRIEAGAIRGRVNTFRLVWPWTRAERTEPQPLRTAEKAAQIIGAVLTWALLLGSGLLARRNLRRGHSDVRGATRLALILGALNFASWALVAEHAPNPGEEWQMMFPHFAIVVFISVLVWVLYVALEPYVRKRWPDSLIGWNRMLAGKLRDPRVGRDLFIGAAASIAMLVLFAVRDWIAGRLGVTPMPQPTALDAIRGTNFVLGLLGDLHTNSIFQPMAMLFLIIGARMIVRRPRVAMLLVWALFTFFAGGDEELKWLALPFAAVGFGLFLFVLMRFGLLAAVASNAISTLVIEFFPLGIDTSRWYATASILSLGYVLTVLAYGYWCSTGRLVTQRRSPVR